MTHHFYNKSVAAEVVLNEWESHLRIKMLSHDYFFVSKQAIGEYTMKKRR